MTTEKTIVMTQERGPSPETSSVASIVLIYGGELGKRYTIVDQATVGRAEANSISLDLANVSRTHARFFCHDGSYYVEDCDSTNGTFVNDVEITHETLLSSGDLITTGGAVFKFFKGDNVEALYHEEIYRLTILDGLTGIHNRRFLLEFLEREIARAARHDRPLALAMVDLDHFKVVNDTYGHLAGDSVLKAVARLMETEVRREELLARYGGEEFALVLPETTSAGATAFCERLRETIADHSFLFDDQEIRVTVSIGVAGLAPGADIAALIRAADQQLYNAKKRGRNRVESGL